jgi:hypothetical protein
MSPIQELQNRLATFPTGVPNLAFTTQLHSSPSKQSAPLPDSSVSYDSRWSHSQGSFQGPKRSLDSVRGSLGSPTDQERRFASSQTQLAPIVAGQPLHDYNSKSSPSGRTSRPHTGESSRTSPIPIQSKKSPTTPNPFPPLGSVPGQNVSDGGSSVPSGMSRRTFSVSMSEFSTSSSSSKLDAACNNPNPYYRLAPDGSIEAGTLEGLISRLLADRPGKIIFALVSTYYLMTG